MSYARFGGGSDVYVFFHVNGFLNCCGCLLEGETDFYTTKAMLDHLDEHKNAGHAVPPYCIESLKEEQEENDAHIERLRNMSHRQSGSKPYGKFHSYEDIECFQCNGSGEEHVKATKPLELGTFVMPGRKAYHGPCRVCDGNRTRTVGRDFEYFFTVSTWRPYKS